MASGIKCSPEVLPAYNSVKEKHLKKYVTFKFNKLKNPDQIVVDQVGEKDATFADLKASLPRDEIRYFVYDCKYQLKDGQPREKVVLVAWSDDDNAPRLQKMLVSSTSDELKAVCTGFSRFMTINDYDELTEEYITEAVSNNYTK